jgi:hypothetical protein
LAASGLRLFGAQAKACAAPVNACLRGSGFALGNVFAHDAFVPLQLPLVIRAVGEPFGNADLRIDLTGRHGDARLVTGGDDLLKAQRTVAENGDKSNEHGDLC